MTTALTEQLDLNGLRRPVVSVQPCATLRGRGGFWPVAVLAAVAPALANDSYVTVGVGGLIPLHSSAVVMESEDLQISVHEITVKYVFRNTSRRDVDAIVAFPLPEINGGEVANLMMAIPARDPLNFIDFQVTVAGRKIAPEVEVRSLYYGTEITGELRGLGLPLSALDGNVAAAMNKLTAADRSRIEKAGWVDCQLTRDGKCWPYWQSRIQYYWTQHFKAGAAVEVRHTYHPIVGGGVLYRGDDVANYADYIKEYCPGSEVIDQIRKKLLLRAGEKPPDHAGPVERRIQYILTTANSWSGPIRKFHLSVVSDSAEDIVLTCMHGLQRAAPVRYELFRSNFRPDREIDLLVLQSPQ